MPSVFDKQPNLLDLIDKISLEHSFGCGCFFCSTNTGLKLKTPTVSDLYLQLEMPGTKRKDIEVKFKGTMLEVKYITRSGTVKYHRQSVPDAFYDRDKVSCTYEDGLLNIKVPALKPNTEEPPPEKEINIEIK